MGPCLCGDCYCPHCGDPGAAAFEAFCDEAIERFEKIAPLPEELHEAFGLFLAENCDWLAQQYLKSIEG
jgi:sarcosine oxidase delta subunit